MKNFILLLTVLSIFSCGSGSILDKKFDYQFYEGLDYKKLLQADDVSESDLFLLNYAIIRQRDYFNYKIEEKTYREILAMAKEFDKGGFPARTKLQDNGKQDKVRISAVPEGVGFAKKSPNSKRILKTFKFKAKFDNPSNKDIVLLNSSFIIRGPFGDHLTTVNYEVNCILEKESSVEISMIVSGKTIQRNLLFENNPLIRRLGIDNILNTMTVHPSGLSTKDQGKYFKECFLNAASMEPHQVLHYKDLENWKEKDSEGNYVLDLGNMHIPDETDEVIQMR